MYNTTHEAIIHDLKNAIDAATDSSKQIVKDIRFIVQETLGLTTENYISHGRHKTTTINTGFIVVREDGKRVIVGYNMLSRCHDVVVAKQIEPDNKNKKMIIASITNHNVAPHNFFPTLSEHNDEYRPRSFKRVRIRNIEKDEGGPNEDRRPFEERLKEAIEKA